MKCPLTVYVDCSPEKCAWYSRKRSKCAVLLLAEATDASNSVFQMIYGPLRSSSKEDSQIAVPVKGTDFCNGCTYLAIQREDHKRYCMKYETSLPLIMGGAAPHRLNICLTEQGYK